MDNIAKGLNILLAPIGKKAHTLVIDYTDKGGVDNYVTAYWALNYDDEYIVASLLNDYTMRGCTITQITELLDGYSQAEIEALAKASPNEAAKHIRFLYFTE